LLLKFLFICSFKLSFSDSQYYGNPCTWRTWWT